MGEVLKKGTADVSSETRLNSLTGQMNERGLVSVDVEVYRFDDKSNIFISTDAGFGADLGGSEYNVIPATIIVGYDSDLVRCVGGLFAGRHIWNDERLAGVKCEHQNFDVSVGRKTLEIWKDGVPQLHLDNWSMGASLAAGLGPIKGKIGYEHELETSGKTEESAVSYTLSANPGIDDVMIFSGARVYIISGDAHPDNKPAGVDGYRVTGGATYRVNERLTAEGTVIATSLPPFFEEMDGWSNYNDVRGRLSALILLDGASVNASAEAGAHSVAGSIEASYSRFNGYALYRHDLDAHANEGGLAASLTFKPLEQLQLKPFGAVSVRDGVLISEKDEGLRFDAGARATYKLPIPLDPLNDTSVSVVAGVAGSPLVGKTGASATVNLVVGGDTFERETPAVTPAPAITSVEQREPRAGGKKMAEAAVNNFPHAYHLSEDAAGANGGELYLCETCHSPLDVAKIKDDIPPSCSEGCHDSEYIKNYNLAVGDGVTHPGNLLALYSIAPETPFCISCHTPVVELEKPTGGVGQLIATPHYQPSWGSEAWLMGALACKTCHSPNVQVEERNIKRHGGQRANEDCTRCHGDMKNGKIIYPHGHEIREPGKSAWANHGAKADITCKTCHSGNVKYKGNKIYSCNDCHDQFKLSGKPLPPTHDNPDRESWMKTLHAPAARGNIEGCTECHTSFSQCRSCHRDEGVMPLGIHSGFGFNMQNGDARKNVQIANRSGGMLCGVCHTPEEFKMHENYEPEIQRFFTGERK